MPEISKMPEMSQPLGRLPVRKTYKLYIGGAFPRSESGRSYPVTAPSGAPQAHVAQASRKDVRDAVRAARAAFTGWAAATGYLRGQVLYRVAELLEGRRDQLAAEILASEAGSGRSAYAQVDAAIDRWVYYAGWADKYSQVAGGTNPVSGPYFNFSTPEPTGVVGIIAPERPGLLGIVEATVPVIATGNTAVVVASQGHPLSAVSLAEALPPSDLPGGVVNILTGHTAELAPWLASHRDVNALDLAGLPEPDRAPLRIAAADSVKRVYAGRPGSDGAPALSRLLAFVETKTVWHPIGS
jgi:acyl-CoA reductase-like NAD-dependent aldehyde dehydrogenase